MENEIWKTIEGYEGIYEVSSIGRIGSLARIDASGHNRKSKIRKTTISNCGYHLVLLSNGENRKNCAVHRIVANAFIPIDDNKLLDVNHIDGNKLNNRVENLEWLTRGENIRHAYELGLSKFVYAKGEKNHKAKLSDSQVREIKLLILAGESNQEIAKKYNVKHYNISTIRTGKRWKHVALRTD